MLTTLPVLEISLSKLKYPGILRYYRDPHAGLWPLRKAAKLVPKVSVLRIPMPIPPLGGSPSAITRKLWRLLFLFSSHLDLPRRIRQKAGKVVLVREFLVLPVLALSPILWPFRKRVWFLLQHNLQSAAYQPVQRHALALLTQLGFGFVVYEDTKTWKICIGNAPKWIADLPMPVMGSELAPERTCLRPSHKPVVGVIGNYRPEKNPNEAIIALLQAIAAGSNYTLLLGSPDEVLRRRWSSQMEAIDTSKAESYWNALARCDVLVISYQKINYEYRTSGVIAEAIAAGVRVVAPDFPVIKNQVNWPAPIGATYATAAEIPDAVERALGISQTEWDAARDKHLEERSIARLAQCLANLCHVSSQR